MLNNNLKSLYFFKITSVSNKVINYSVRMGFKSLKKFFWNIKSFKFKKNIGSFIKISRIILKSNRTGIFDGSNIKPVRLRALRTKSGSEIRNVRRRGFKFFKFLRRSRPSSRTAKIKHLYKSLKTYSDTKFRTQMYRSNNKLFRCLRSRRSQRKSFKTPSNYISRLSTRYSTLSRSFRRSVGKYGYKKRRFRRVKYRFLKRSLFKNHFLLTRKQFTSLGFCQGSVLSNKILLNYYNRSTYNWLCIN